MNNKRFIPNRADITSSCRAVTKPGLYSVLPQANRVESAIPGFENVKIEVLVTPELGADFIQYELVFDEGTNNTINQNDELEHFILVLEGEITIVKTELKKVLKQGGFAYIPPNTNYNIEMIKSKKTRVLLTKKIYQSINSIKQPSLIFSDIQKVPTVVCDTYLEQRLIPYDENLAYDMAMNILHFEPGIYFSFVESHAMKHGLYMLDGGGIYWLNGDYHEVQKNDYIYMAAYCPQFFYATGWEKGSYLLYKDVNRDYIVGLKK